MSNLEQLYASHDQKARSNVLCKNRDLSANQLEGAIPAELGNLFHLRGLYVDVNCTHARQANSGNRYLSDNDLSFSIPTSVGNLENLEVLYVMIIY